MKQEIRDLIESKGIADDWSTREIVALETEIAVLLSRVVSLDDATKMVRSAARANFDRGWIRGNARG